MSKANIIMPLALGLMIAIIPMVSSCTKDVSVNSVSISKTSLELMEGNSETLSATVKPDNATNKNVSWGSSDNSVATVDATGKVTAVKAGSATITVVTKEGGKTASCTVTVIEKTYAVESVSLNQTSLILTDGGSQRLFATVKPDNATDKSVTWSSSDKSVATVDATGKVTAVKAGSATITVTTKDGEKTASCTVTVFEKTYAVESVSLDKTSLELIEGDSETLSATVKPDNATDKYVTWSSSDKSVATVDATGKVTAVKAGSATITVTTIDGGKTASCTITVFAPNLENIVDDGELGWK